MDVGTCLLMARMVAAAFDLLSSYCPYANIQKAVYPSLLVTACMHDNQVKYWQPAKFVAKVNLSMAVCPLCPHLTPPLCSAAARAQPQLQSHSSSGG